MNLAQNTHCVITVESSGLDLIVEGKATKVRDETRLQQIADAYAVQGWHPTVQSGVFSADRRRWRKDDGYPLLAQQVGQTKDLWVRVADAHRSLMRLLIIRVPEEVAKRRRADLEAEALRRNRPIRQRACELADWTILLTDAPAQCAGSSGASVGTMANGDALQAVEAIRTD